MPDVDTERAGRHMGRVMISRSLINSLVCPSKPGLWWRIVEGVPTDAEYRGSAFDVECNSFVLYFEHPSFPEVQEHERIDYDILVEMQQLEWPQ